MKKKIKVRPLALSIFFAFLGFMAYMVDIPFLNYMELKTIDLRFNARGPIEPRPDVVLAVIDSKSLEREGKWVWPRWKIAQLVDKLSDGGAKVIAFDIAFIEPDDKEVVSRLTEVENKIKTLSIDSPELIQFIEQQKIKSNNDQMLATAIENSKAKVVLGYFFEMEDTGAGYGTDFDVLEENIRGSRHDYIRYTSEDALDFRFIEAKIPQSNISTIASKTNYSGFFNNFPDVDGVVRRIPCIITFLDQQYAPLSLIALSAYLDEQINIEVDSFGVTDIRIGDIYVPTDEIGRLMVNYRGNSGKFPHYSVTDILHDKIPSENFKGKIVIVGATATAVYDMRVTPFGSIFPGLEIHANVIDMVLSQDFLHLPAIMVICTFLILIGASLLLGIFLPRMRGIAGAILTSIIFFAYILFCYYMFVEQGWIINMVYPLVTILLIYISLTTYQYLLEARERKFIHNAFSTYLAPSVVKEIIESPEKLELGGEEREITAFFSDIQGFTTISERLLPPALVELLNEFLTEMTDIIYKYKGTVDKFEGDAIIAFFGAPVALENHAETACLACIEMQKRLVLLRQKWKVEKKPELLMRIGLHSGLAVVGNMGSRSRMDYTMMGNTVNVAARLEGVNKQYGLYTLIGDSTQKMIPDSIMTREVDYIRVLGKKKPLTIYELMGHTEDTTSDVKKVIDLYTEGLYAYRRQQWNKAIDYFEKALKVDPNDTPSIFMILRCQEFKVSLPGDDWDGVYEMKSK